MKKIAIVLLAGLTLSACTVPGKLVLNNIPNACEGRGHSFTWIKYGDSHLGALAFTQIGRKSEWRFRLIPDKNTSYEGKLVTISAKPAYPPQPWLSISGRYSDNDVLVLCVPDTLELGDEIFYMIEVEDVGFLDPRAEVVN